MRAQTDRFLNCDGGEWRAACRPPRTSAPRTAGPANIRPSGRCQSPHRCASRKGSIAPRRTGVARSTQIHSRALARCCVRRLCRMAHQLIPSPFKALLRSSAIREALKASWRCISRFASPWTGIGWTSGHSKELRLHRRRRLGRSAQPRSRLSGPTTRSSLRPHIRRAESWNRHGAYRHNEPGLESHRRRVASHWPARVSEVHENELPDQRPI